MLTDQINSYSLQNGVSIPCLGFGTYKAAKDGSANVLKLAIEAGYRYFDTASFYGTETYLAEAIEESGLPRQDFFITSKLWKNEMGYQKAKEAFQRTLQNLHTDYLDQYLIHWPVPDTDSQDWRQLDRDTWQALEELYQEGKIRSIGVSNFLPHHLENLLQHCEVAPMADQLEYHIGYTQETAVTFCQQHGIIVQAWSPLGRNRLLNEPVITKMAARYQVTPAQLCLRFIIQNQVIPLPKASSMERMKENLDVFSFQIDEEDMVRLKTLPQMGWSGEYPDKI